jgi:TPP-dependent pyruvate/acetoin dehydrogenase alpha subunit
VRAGAGPELLECKTYRLLGHFVGDPMVYRPEGEKAAWEQKDAIQRFKKHLLENGLAGEDELAGLDRLTAEEVEQAVRFAKDSPFPEPEEAMQHVYADWIWGDEYK